MLPNVLITETLDPKCADHLAQHARVTWARSDQPELFFPALAQADALIVRTYTQVNAALLDKAPNVRVVGRAGVGLDNIDVPACRARGVEVVYTPDANTQAVVEYVLALMLDALRPRAEMTCGIDEATFHEMRKTQVGIELRTLSLGILGLGRIGKRIGQVAHAIGMNVIGNDLLPEVDIRKAIAYPLEFVDKATLYAKSDVLTIHVDGRSDNRHLINAQVLSQLKPTCLLINAARGMLVDHAALADWLGECPGARAVLDVHDPEPPTSDNPLFGLPNARLLPHLASRTDVAMQNMSWVVHDVLAVLDGRDPCYPAPPDSPE